MEQYGPGFDRAEDEAGNDGGSFVWVAPAEGTRAGRPRHDRGRVFGLGAGKGPDPHRAGWGLSGGLFEC